MIRVRGKDVPILDQQGDPILDGSGEPAVLTFAQWLVGTVLCDPAWGKTATSMLQVSDFKAHVRATRGNIYEFTDDHYKVIDAVVETPSAGYVMQVKIAGVGLVDIGDQTTAHIRAWRTLLPPKATKSKAKTKRVTKTKTKTKTKRAKKQK